MEDEADDVVRALERDLPVFEPHTHDNVDRAGEWCCSPRPQEERHVLFKIVAWS